MAVYTVRLAATLTGAATDAPIFTAPSGQVTVIRDVLLVPTTTGAFTDFLYIAGVGNFVGVSGAVAGVPTHFDIRQVIEPGEVLHQQTSAGSAWWAFVTGYALT